MAITLVRRRTEDTGLRPLRPSRDMLGVADLIEEAFAGEFDRSGRKALREMREFGRWGFLMAWVDWFASDVNTNLNGFVWTDRGKIVGNTTISRNAADSRQWFVSNVAVAKPYRGRGIARQLMEAAIEYAKELRGKSVSLYVRRGNKAAVHLYQSMGFKYVSATSLLYLPRVKTVESLPLPRELNWRNHNLDDKDAHAAYQLAKAVTPLNVQQERPLYLSQFRMGAEVSFNNFWRGPLGLGTARHWVIEDEPGRFAAMMSVEPGLWNGKHRLRLMVHPDWWGKLEAPLISAGLAHLKTCLRRPVSFQHPDEHAPGIQAYQQFGFKVRRTHLWMKLVL